MIFDYFLNKNWKKKVKNTCFFKMYILPIFFLMKIKKTIFGSFVKNVKINEKEKNALKIRNDYPIYIV